MRLSPGDLLDGRFEVLSVHAGGMGIVYIVRDRETGGRLAAKTIRDELREDARVRQRFEREVSTWIRLGRHPHLVAAHFTRLVDGAPFLFLECVDGPTLASVLRADEPMHPAEAALVALQCSRGLAFAHEAELGGGVRGLVHRDVKPENIFLTRERMAKVSDLGIAKVLTAGLEVTAEGIGVGTPYYVSPEQLKGAAGVDGRADVYSLGAVLFQMLAGRLPLQADSLEGQIYQILRVRPEAPSRFNPAVPAALDRIVLRCLEKTPDARYPGFRPLADDLAALLARPEDLPAATSTCTVCGYASSHGPEKCPVCGSAMGPPTPFAVPAGVGEEVRRERVPARVRVRGVEISPRLLHVGEEMTVNVCLANEGTEPAQRATLSYVVPDQDTFRLLSSDPGWRGRVPPTGTGKCFEVSWRAVPLREGAFALPAVEVRYAGEGGRREAARGEPVALTVASNYHLPTAGRDRERESLLAFAGRRRSGFVLVEGEAGSGKSRFLADAEEGLGTAGYRVLRGKALENGRETFKLLHDVARQVFGIGAEVLSASSLMARVIDRLAPLLGEDPGSAAFFAAFLREAAPSETQVAMREYLWYRLLSALARERPLALVLDDLQWADEATFDLLEHFVRRAAEESVPLLVVGATLLTDPDERTRRRISRLRDRFAAMATNAGLTLRVTLRPLGVEEVRRLLETVFPGNTLGEDHPWLLPALTAVSGGNAFYLTHVLRLLREARDAKGEPLVSAEGGAWQLRPEMNEAALREFVPQAVDDMVRAVVLPLPEEARGVLEAAAIVGEEFDAALLPDLVEEGADIDRALETLEQADLVRAVDEAGERFRFTGSLLPLVLERRVRERSRRGYARLHRQVAAALERRLGKAGLKRVAARYARHLLLAGDRENALKWLIAAAESTVRQQHYLRAEVILSQAARLLEEGVEADGESRGAYFFLRGEVCRVTGQFGEALSAYEEAAARLGESGARADLARTLSRMGEVHKARGEVDRALYCMDLGAQIREDMGDAAGMAHSANGLGLLHALRGEEGRAKECFERARSLATKSRDDGALADALDNLAALAVRRGEYEAAEGLYAESRKLGERTGDRLGVGRSLNGQGTLCLRRGRLDEALALYRQAIEIRREVGDREGTANILSNLGVIHDRLGDYENALSYYRRSVEIHRAIGARRGLATVLNNIGVVNLTRGDVGMAMQRFEEALAIRREMGDRERLGLSLLNLAEAKGHAGNTEASMSLFAEALDAFRAVEDAEGAAEVLASRAAHRRRTGDLAGAERDLAEALGVEGRSPRTRAQVHIEMAELHATRGERAAAERAAERGLALAGEAQDRALRAQALRILGRLRAETGDPGGAMERLSEAEKLLAATSGPELVRVLIDQSAVLRESDPTRSREIRMRARGLLDALEVRGARFPSLEAGA